MGLKISDLTDVATLALGDQMEVQDISDLTDDPAGTSKFATLTELLAFITTNLQKFATYAVGTAYSLTNTPAALDFGTTDPVIVLTTAGTYRISGFVNIKYNAATFAAARDVTIKLRRTNNTAADLTNGTIVVTTNIITTLTYTFATIYWEAADYTTTNTDDSITIFGDVSTAPTAGSLDVIAAFVKARRVA